MLSLDVAGEIDLDMIVFVSFAFDLEPIWLVILMLPLAATCKLELKLTFDLEPT